MDASKSSADEAREDQENRIGKVLVGIRRKLLVMSGKGGVGKSTIAVNLAVSLAGRGHSVGLMDVDLHGPNTLKMLGLEDKTLTTDGRLIFPLQYDGRLKVISIASLLSNPDTAVIWRGPMKIGVIKQFVGDVVWGGLDYLVIDAPPGTGDEPLTIAQAVTGAEAIVVTTPQAVSLLDIRKSITFCRQLSMPIVGIVENMSGMKCPHCGRMIELFGAGGGERTAAEMGVSFLGRLPLDPAVVESGDEGLPFVSRLPSSPVAQVFQRIADRIIEAEPPMGGKTGPNAAAASPAFGKIGSNAAADGDNEDRTEEDAQ
jgi:Mrp family chromosome partitioning ATPase